MSRRKMDFLSLLKIKLEALQITEKKAKKDLVSDGVVSQSMAYRFFKGDNIHIDALGAIFDYFGIGKEVFLMKDSQPGGLVISPEDLAKYDWLQSLAPALKSGNEYLILGILEAAAKGIKDNLTISEKSRARG